MRLSIFRGIAHDLAHNLEFIMFTGGHRQLIRSFPVEINALDGKTMLHKHCLHFFKERLPKSFDFSRVKEIKVKLVKPVSPGLNVLVKIKVDDKEFKYQAKSLWA